MQPQEPVINDPGEVPTTPTTEVIQDPDIPIDAPVDDVFDPATEEPDVTD
jgi:hypothetical protein